MPSLFERGAHKLQDIWYRPDPPPWWLRCLEFPYRAWARQRSGRPVGRPPVPLVVVGNLVAGGTGKTPLVIYLVELLLRQGHHPAVISRGYGGRGTAEVLRVDSATPAAVAGDEPCLIHARCGVGVWVHRQRVLAMQAAVAAGADVIVSDDGLQHRALPRSVELCTIDSARGFGNGHLLPAGPLREPVGRLAQVDFVIYKGSAPNQPHAHAMTLLPQALRHLGDGRIAPVQQLRGKTVSAIAGIGHPDHFFTLLGELGCDVRAHPRPDHQAITAAQMRQLPRPVVMTAKDAVKLSPEVDRTDVWVLDVEARLSAEFDRDLLHALAVN